MSEQEKFTPEDAERHELELQLTKGEVGRELSREERLKPFFEYKNLLFDMQGKLDDAIDKREEIKRWIEAHADIVTSGTEPGKIQVGGFKEFCDLFKRSWEALYPDDESVRKQAGGPLSRIVDKEMREKGIFDYTEYDKAQPGRVDELRGEATEIDDQLKNAEWQDTGDGSPDTNVPEELKTEEK